LKHKVNMVRLADEFR